MSSFGIKTPSSNVLSFGASSPIPSGGEQTQVLTNVSGINTWSYSQYYYKGSNMFPSNNVSNSSSIPIGSYRNGGACLSLTGNVYFGPFAGTTTKINPYTDSISYISTPGNYGYGGMVCANNGKIFMLPWTSASTILIIDTLNNDRVSYLDASGIITSSSHRGLVNYNNFIYAIPHNSDSILRIDPNTNNIFIDISGINTTNYPSLISNSNKFSGGVVGSDGNIYCIPSSAARALRFNPLTNVVETSQTPDISGYMNGVLSTNNRIYMIPGLGNNIGYIDISNFNIPGLAANTSLTSFTNTAGTSTNISALGSGGSAKFQSGILAQNGLIYTVPNTNSRVLAIDTSSNMATQIFPLTNGNLGSDAFSGCVLAPNGKLYIAPLNNSTALIIKTGIPTNTSWMYAPSFNKTP